MTQRSTSVPSVFQEIVTRRSLVGWAPNRPKDATWAADFPLDLGISDT